MDLSRLQAFGAIVMVSAQVHQIGGTFETAQVDADVRFVGDKLDLACVGISNGTAAYGSFDFGPDRQRKAGEVVSSARGGRKVDNVMKVQGIVMHGGVRFRRGRWEIEEEK